MRIQAVHQGSEQGISTAVNTAIQELEADGSRILDIKYAVTSSGNAGDTSSLILAFIHYEEPKQP